MNKAFSKTLTNVISAVRSKPDPIVMFGVGNFNSLSSRNSVAVRAINSLVNKLNMKWIDFPHIGAQLSYSPENHLLFVKSDTHLTKDNYEVLKRLLVLMPNIKTDTFCAIHYEHLYKLGMVESIYGGRTRHNDGLIGITSVFQTEKYHRIPIGIAHPIDDISFQTTPYSLGSAYEDTVTPFVVNRFPDVQMELVDKVVVPYAVNEIMSTISKIKKDISQKENEDDQEREISATYKTSRIELKD